MSMLSPETLYVCPLDAIEAMVARVRPGHLISLVNEEAMGELARPESVPAHRHLRLAMNDISAPEPELTAPSPEHVSALIDFAMSWDRAAPLLINCLAGVSRSTAAAFTIACALNPETAEALIARLLRETSPTAQPNRRLVGFADDALGRDGRMVRAAEEIAASAAIEPVRPFAMPARIAIKA